MGSASIRRCPPLSSAQARERLRQDCVMQRAQARGQLVEGLITSLLRLGAEDQDLVALIDAAADHVVEDAGHQQALHLRLVDVELFGDERDTDAGIGPDEFHQHLRADVAQQVLDMLPDELIFHDRSAILPKDALEAVDVVVLVGRHKVCHRQDLRVVLIGLGFLLKEKLNSARNICC